MRIPAPLSKHVGLEPREVAWPTFDDIATGSAVQLLTWYRFLPSPDTPERVEIINAVVARMEEVFPDEPRHRHV